MKNYRIIETNEIIPHNELRAAFPHVSFADGDAIELDILEALGLEPAPDTPDAPQPVPQSATRKQARKALALAGLFDAVQPAIDAIEDPLERLLAQIDWDDAQDYERSDPFLSAMAAALGLDGEALDGLFVQAALL